MSDLRCCPECGCTDFKQRRYAVIEYTVNVYGIGGEFDAAEEIVDGGDRDEPLRCDDCGEEYEGYDELSTEAEYARVNDDEAYAMMAADDA